MEKFKCFNSLFTIFISANNRKYQLLLVLVFCSSLLFPKNLGKKVYSIPFEMVGSYVIVKVKVNNSTPLNLILDTGIRNTIITEIDSNDKIALIFSDVKDVMGLGSGNSLEAFKSDFNELKIGKMKIASKTVYVLREDVFNLSKHTGYKINGLIGLDFFYNYVVEVNISERRINFYNPTTFIASDEYDALPLTISNQKIIVNLQVKQSETSSKYANMLLDTGAELNAWFQTCKNNSVKIPDQKVRSVIGEGFSGEILGYIAKLPQICLGKYCMENQIVSFPDSASIFEVVKDNDRDGTIGAQLLYRFNYIVDITNRMFYIKPNENFRKKSTYNIAGIELIQIFPGIPQTEVWRVWENSPAAIAGIQVGDQIIEINSIKSFQLNVYDLKTYFATPSKKPLSIVVLRNGKEISFSLNMKSNI